ncbi:MAG: DUF2490 domain-containing protein [Cytophagales bacterium]|nr:DUF2490 domain-containing protein [Bernardetiaceae bacterium]MDW8204735.1 DUF2490 domain-containing protein [Cytophagales bacterium]
MKSRLVVMMWLILCLGANAQDGVLGSWNAINIRYELHTRLSLFGEAQLRSLRFYDHFHYYEYKGGFTYKAYPNVYTGIGIGRYDTFREGGNFVRPKNNSEIRLWPHLSLMQYIGKLKIEQRYRMEMRFTTNGYRNRFRYRAGVAYPFGNTHKGYQPYWLSVTNELFFTDREPYFERNRLAFSLTKRFSPEVSVQIGYLHQFDYRINDETGTDFLQIGIFIEMFDPKKRNSKVMEPEIKED